MVFLQYGHDNVSLESCPPNMISHICYRKKVFSWVNNLVLFQISRNYEMFSTWLMNIYLHFNFKRFCALTTRERLVTLFMPKKSSTLGELFVTYFALEQLFSCVDGLMLFQNIRSFEMFPTVVTDQSHMLLLILLKFVVGWPVNGLAHTSPYPWV